MEGTTIAPKRHLLGNNGLVQVDDVDLDRGFDRWIQSGFPHHVCVVEGRRKDTFLRFANNFDIVIMH